jgi:hypothetical protein
VFSCQPLDAAQVGVVLWQRQGQRKSWTARPFLSSIQRSGVDNVQPSYCEMTLETTDEMVVDTDGEVVVVARWSGQCLLSNDHP